MNNIQTVMKLKILIIIINLTYNKCFADFNETENNISGEEESNSLEVDFEVNNLNDSLIRSNWNSNSILVLQQSNETDQNERIKTVSNGRRIRKATKRPKSRSNRFTQTIKTTKSSIILVMKSTTNSENVWDWDSQEKPKPTPKSKVKPHIRYGFNGVLGVGGNNAGQFAGNGWGGVGANNGNGGASVGSDSGNGQSGGAQRGNWTGIGGNNLGNSWGGIGFNNGNGGSNVLDGSGNGRTGNGNCNGIGGNNNGENVGNAKGGVGENRAALTLAPILATVWAEPEMRTESEETDNRFKRAENPIILETLWEVSAI